MTDNQEHDGAGERGWLASYFTPVFTTALLILLGVFFVIGMTILGWDRGTLLRNMATVEYARGLITYLFAVVTIGTAVVLVVSALSHAADPDSDKKFQRAKEILALLLGVFGTIVGYYFGSEKGAPPPLRLAAPEVMPGEVAVDGSFVVTTAVVGGTPPYLYRLSIGRKTIAEHQPVKESGLIIYEGKPNDLAGVTPGRNSLEVSVTDGTSRVTTATKDFTVAGKNADRQKK